MKATVPAAETDMGRALLALAELVGPPDAPADTLLAADYALNPFAGLWYGTAFFTDKTHRGNRLIETGEVLTDLAGHAEERLQGVIGLLEEGEFEAAFDRLGAFLVARFSGRSAYAALQAGVLEEARNLCEAGAQWDIPWQVCLPCLANAHISLQSEAPASGRGDEAREPISFLSLADAAHLPPASVHTLVLGDLNADAYPVRDPEGALVTLLEKLNSAPEADALAGMRRAFAGAAAAASHTLVLERALHDETADETQAAVIFDEALAVYRTDTQRTADLDKATGAPLSLAPFCTQRGEQDLLGNAAGGGADTPDKDLPAPVTGTISDQAKTLVVLPRLYGRKTFAGLDLSASQIESYLECPYQWFAKRRLKLETIEEGFGPLERGTFIHLVLERFYERFQEEVAPKVTSETVPAASALLREVFLAAAAEQPLGHPGNRYAPADAWEEQVLASLLPQLDSALSFEAALLPRFRPWKLEWGYGEAEPYRYAGANILGRIDRIDIDDEGRVVIIDYKSSLSGAYRLHEGAEQDAEALQLPAKMQALIYAKAVRDTLGCQVVGTLYVNPLKREVLGAYDRTELDSSEIPFATSAAAESCGVPWGPIRSFNQLIDDGERLVGERMERLAAGEVAPNPLGANACEYCPVGNCPERLATRKV